MQFETKLTFFLFCHVDLKHLFGKLLEPMVHPFNILTVMNLFTFSMNLSFKISPKSFGINRDKNGGRLRYINMICDQK